MVRVLSLTCLLFGISVSAAAQQVQVSGGPRVWQRVTLTFDGPHTSETAQPNPFADFRLNVPFIHADQRYVVPGFYAADGDAAVDR